jgi:hypothetical protein
VDPRRLRIGEWLAGIGGAALLAALFVGWYGIEGYEGVSRTAWEVFTVMDVLLALMGGLAIATAAMAAAHRAPAVSLAMASLLALIGLVLTIVVVVRTVAPPDFAWEGIAVVPAGEQPSDDVSRAPGLWIGLAACVLTTIGAFAAMRDERTPRAAQVDLPIETLPPPEGGKA